MSTITNIDIHDNLPHIKLDNDFSVDLTYLADLASVDFAPENMGTRFNSIDSTCSTTSSYDSPSLNPLDDSLLNYCGYSPSGAYVSSPPPPTLSHGHFFPANFDADDVWNQHYNAYMLGNQVQDSNSSFQLSSISKSSLKMKRKRASRSKCPCVKCCSARVNGFPSPINHSCVVKNCSKTYTRPAHLRSHLKTHENQATLKCDMCSKSFMKAEMLINHMFEHGNEMRLFWAIDLFFV